jgi:hypothetical protein
VERKTARPHCPDLRVIKESAAGKQSSNRITILLGATRPLGVFVAITDGPQIGRKDSVIETRRLQRSFGDGLIAAEIKDLQETWMRHVDIVLEDDAIVSAVHQALMRRHPNSRTHGRPGFPAEVVVRLLILKHLRNWSYAVLEREVRANLVYRDFTRVGADKMPDAKTMGRWGIAQS